MNHQYVRPRNHPPIIVRLAPVILFFLLLLVNACEKDIQYLSGQLVGSVILYDSEIKRMPDHSGVEITVEGSNPLIKAITNEKGQFVIDDLKSGTYNFIFNKEGYYQHKQNGYMFVGGPKPSSIYRTVLFGIPDGRIENLEISEEERHDQTSISHKGKNSWFTPLQVLSGQFRCFIQKLYLDKRGHAQRFWMVWQSIFSTLIP
jgi:hypothetical protein